MPLKPKHFFVCQTQSFIIFPLFQHSYMLQSNDHHHQTTNTKSQSEVKYSASVFIMWDLLSSQQLLRYKLYVIVAIYITLL